MGFFAKTNKIVICCFPRFFSAFVSSVVNSERFSCVSAILAAELGCF